MTHPISGSAPHATWQWSAFDELTPGELYAAIQLRQMVFVVEQACPFLDADGLDARAMHLLGWVTTGTVQSMLGAYVRVLPAGVAFPEASIGRVVTHPAVRRTGLGRELMAEAIRRTESLTPAGAIRIGAQRYLERFYAGFGFESASEPYLEDGIPHIHMVRQSAFSPVSGAAGSGGASP